MSDHCILCGERTDGEHKCVRCQDLDTVVDACTLRCYMDENRLHIFYCENTECKHYGDGFLHNGLPTICPECGEAQVSSAITLVDIYIREKQQEEMKAIEAIKVTSSTNQTIIH